MALLNMFVHAALALLLIHVASSASATDCFKLKVKNAGLSYVNGEYFLSDWNISDTIHSQSILLLSDSGLDITVAGPYTHINNQSIHIFRWIAADFLSSEVSESIRHSMRASRYLWYISQLNDLFSMKDDIDYYATYSANGVPPYGGYSLGKYGVSPSPEVECISPAHVEPTPITPAEDCRYVQINGAGTEFVNGWYRVSDFEEDGVTATEKPFLTRDAFIDISTVSYRRLTDSLSSSSSPSSSTIRLLRWIIPNTTVESTPSQYSPRFAWFISDLQNLFTVNDDLDYYFAISDAISPPTNAAIDWMVGEHGSEPAPIIQCFSALPNDATVIDVAASAPVPATPAADTNTDTTVPTETTTTSTEAPDSAPAAPSDSESATATPPQQQEQPQHPAENLHRKDEL
eukprot:TRINITY_DN315_c4_g1_i1.p1 TRINITY_DN315_c4_g1~~TRINITY_DN315_c4_g1_i1.p1  ORF type:complete len:403 (-),score=88.69 TRINITY_DN315_c4_g1_i1:82-1290(-)